LEFTPRLGVDLVQLSSAAHLLIGSPRGRWGSIVAEDEQHQKPTPVSFSNSDDAANAIGNAPSDSPEDVLRYLRETRGEDDTEE
jgi:hypothetical protein